MPFCARSHALDAPMLAGWLARQETSVVVAPRLIATNTLPVAFAGVGTDRLKFPAPLLSVTALAVVPVMAPV